MGHYPGGTYETVMTQHPEEIAIFGEILRYEGVRSLLEVGSRFGGSLWFLAQRLPQGSRVVSIDSGMGMGSKPGAVESLCRCIEALNGLGYDAHVLNGNSHDGIIIERARSLGPYDAVFIDGGHSLQDVTSDWQNFGPMGRIIAFHDIMPSTPIVEVFKLWNGLNGKLKSKAIVAEGSSMGIGVLWH